MKLNLQEIKSKILTGDESLVDETLLSSDMRSMFEYYSESSDKPPRIQLYFDKYMGFESQAFAEAYLSSFIGVNVKTEYTEDGWMRLFTD